MYEDQPREVLEKEALEETSVNYNRCVGGRGVGLGGLVRKHEEGAYEWTPL